MNKKQQKAFRSIYISFCIVATAFPSKQGAFNNQGLGADILGGSFLSVGFFIYLDVKSNAVQIEKWFE